jgi:TRAP-type C4-dicarboxylate transport system permease small subunit
MVIIKKIAESISNFAARVGMLAIAVLLFMTVGDVIGRFVFNHPIPGTFELTKILFALSVFFSLSVSQYNGENLGITIIYDRVPTRFQGVLDLISSVISIATFSVAFSQTLKYAARMRSSNTTTSVLRWPMYPWIYLASAGLILLILVLVWDLAKAVNLLKGEKSDES